jgi:hypothetical protein
MSARCGLCNIPVEAKEFKAHSESIEHLVNQRQMLDCWVKIQTLGKESPEKAYALIEGIKDGSIKRI